MNDSDQRLAVSERQTTEPSSDVLRWLAEAVGPGATVRAVRRLPGATSSVLHSVEVDHKGRSAKLVLRQFVNEQWLADEPDIARHEAASLEKAREADVPTPELIACDETGDRCGVPAVLMTALPGSVELAPADFDGWLHQLAEAACSIHAVKAGTHPWRYFTYNDISCLEPPSWSARPKLWERALEIVRGPRPQTRECFIHRDYHPTNVLWRNGQVSGVVDWVNACCGSPGFDVAHCRLNLAYLYGAGIADRFLRAYVSLAGASSEYHPYWDLMAIIEFLPGPPEVYDGWVAFGIRHLTNDIMRERADEYLASVMARL